MNNILDNLESDLPSYYSITPASVRYNRNLPANAKLLYGEITCLSNSYGFCFSTNNYFAKLYDVEPETVSTWIKKLKEDGHICTETVNTGGKYVRIIWLPEVDLDSLKENIKGALKKNIKGALKENLKAYYNIINSITTRDNKEVVDSEESTNCSEDSSCGKVKEKQPPAEHHCKYVEYWNTKENLRKHKNTSKTYKNAMELFTLFRTGRFGKMYSLSDKYMEVNKIASDLLRKPLSDAEIFEAIDRFDRMHRPEYGSTRGFPVDCDKFLYNADKGTSFFLSKIGPDKDPTPSYEKPLDDTVLKLYKKSLFKKDLGSEGESELIKGVNVIVRNRREFIDKFKGFCSRMGVYSQQGLYNLHISFLREKYLDSGRLSVDTIKRKDIWREFVRWAKEVHKVDLNPDQKAVERIIFAYEEIHKKNGESQENCEEKNVRAKDKPSERPTQGIRARCQKAEATV